MRTNTDVLRWLVMVLLFDCTTESHESRVRGQIEAAILRGVEATRAQDIEAYMAGIPQDLVVPDPAGGTVRGATRC